MQSGQVFSIFSSHFGSKSVTYIGGVASLLLFGQLPDGLLDAGRAIFINNIVLDVMDQQGSIVDLVSLDDFDFLSWISFCLDRGMQALKAVRAVRAGE